MTPLAILARTFGRIEVLDRTPRVAPVLVSVYLIHGDEIVYVGSPLAPRPLSPAELTDLVARVRERSRRARSTAWRRRGEDGRFLPDDPEVS